MGQVRVKTKYEAVFYGFLDGIVGDRKKKTLTYLRELYEDAYREGEKASEQVVAVNKHGVIFCKLCITNANRKRWFEDNFEKITPSDIKPRSRRKVFRTTSKARMKHHLSKQHKAEIFWLIPDYLKKALNTVLVVA